MLTTKETAKVLGISEQTLSQHRSKDKNLLQPVRIGDRQWRYSSYKVLAYRMGRNKEGIATPKALNARRAAFYSPGIFPQDWQLNAL